MKLISLENGIKLYEMENKSEMEEYLNGSGVICLGEESIVKNKFYVAEIVHEGIVKKIEILNESHGIKPVIAKLDNTKYIVTSDKIISLINVINNTIIKKIICTSLIYEIYCVSSRRILIICELGIRCIDYCGNEIWKYESDFIENFEVNNECIIIENDNEKCIISVDSGEKVVK